MTNINEDIIIDKDTQEDIRSIVGAIGNLKRELQLIIRVYVKANGKEGTYRISDDAAKLEKVKESSCGSD